MISTVNLTTHTLKNTNKLIKEENIVFYLRFELSSLSSVVNMLEQKTLELKNNWNTRNWKLKFVQNILEKITFKLGISVCNNVFRIPSNVSDKPRKLYAAI